ncbi:MAG: HNH endonuclease [Patescibacteria group bacterium]|nr:HNH endonuclease [Patescibacteria group bacterium]
MAYERKPGSGALFPNKERKSEKSPNATGYVIAHRDIQAGERLSLAAWTKETDRGKFQSLRLSDPYQREDDGTRQTEPPSPRGASRTSERKREPVPEDAFYDDEIPFEGGDDSMTTREIWRVVPSVPSIMASSEGRIRVLPYEKPMPHGGVRRYDGKPRRGSWAADQRRYILVFRRRTYKVAALVCEAFHGGRPFARAVVMHLNERSTDNRQSNLAWGTQKENLNAPGFIAYCKNRRGADSPAVKGRLRRTAARSAIIEP